MAVLPGFSVLGVVGVTAFKFRGIVGRLLVTLDFFVLVTGETVTSRPVK